MAKALFAVTVVGVFTTMQPAKLVMDAEVVVGYLCRKTLFGNARATIKNLLQLVYTALRMATKGSRR